MVSSDFPINSIADSCLRYKLNENDGMHGKRERRVECKRGFSFVAQTVSLCTQDANLKFAVQRGKLFSAPSVIQNASTPFAMGDARLMKNKK